MKYFTLATLGLALAIVVSLSIARRSTHPEAIVRGRPVADWILALDSPAAAEREKAGQEIAQWAPDLAPSLVLLLRTPDPVLAKPMKAASWRLPGRVRAAFFQILDPYEARRVRAAAAHALRLMGTNSHAALDALSAAIHDDPAVAWHAALALANLGKSGIEVLSQAVSTTEPTQTRFACYALGTQRQKASNAIPALSAALRTRSLDVAEKAASALSSIGTLAVPSLVDCLADTDPERRALAAKALGSMGLAARESLPILIDRARKDQPVVRAAAVDAVARIGLRSPLTTDTLAAALGDPDRAVRLTVVDALTRSPRVSKTVEIALLNALNDESPEIRGRSATLLTSIGTTPESIIPVLRARVLDENEYVRTRARQALDHFQKKTHTAPAEITPLGTP